MLRWRSSCGALVVGYLGVGLFVVFRMTSPTAAPEGDARGGRARLRGRRAHEHGRGPAQRLVGADRGSAGPRSSSTAGAGTSPTSTSCGPRPSTTDEGYSVLVIDLRAQGESGGAAARSATARCATSSARSAGSRDRATRPRSRAPRVVHGGNDRGAGGARHRRCGGRGGGGVRGPAAPARRGHTEDRAPAEASSCRASCSPAGSGPTSTPGPSGPSGRPRGSGGGRAAVRDPLDRGRAHPRTSTRRCSPRRTPGRGSGSCRTTTTSRPSPTPSTKSGSGRS